MALKSAFGLPYIGRPMNHAKPRAVPCHWPIWARLATKARLLARSRLIYLPIDQFSLFYGAEKRVWPSIYRTTHRARKTACSSMPLAHVGLFGTTSSGTDKQDKYSQYRAMPLHTPGSCIRTPISAVITAASQKCGSPAAVEPLRAAGRKTQPQASAECPASNKHVSAGTLIWYHNILRY